ncbi:MAG: YraN family protein [Cyclobacteriaceae bacterium]
MESKKMNTLAIGTNGERMAEKFLINKGYKLLRRNYRYKRAEIDLIMQTEDVITFIEVKTRKNKAFGNPEEFVTEMQAERIMDAAENYLAENKLDIPFRFDIVAITMNPVMEILHLEDAIA